MIDSFLNNYKYDSFSTKDRGIFVGMDYHGYIVLSYDNGLSWINGGKPGTGGTFASIAKNGISIIGSGSTTKSISTDYGNSWKSLITSASFITSIKDLVIILNNSRTYQYSIDYGSSFNIGAYNTVGASTYSTILYLDNVSTKTSWSNTSRISKFDSKLGNSGIFIIGTAGATLGGYVYLLSDYGTKFTNLGKINSNITYINFIIHLGDGIILIGTGNKTSNVIGNIYRSIDWGNTWIDLGRIFNADVIDGFSYGNNGIVIAGISNSSNEGHIIRSIDYGNIWSDIGWIFSSTSIYSTCYLERGIFIATAYINSNTNIIKSIDNGLTWNYTNYNTSMLPYAQNGINNYIYLGNGIIIGCTAIATNGGYIIRSTDYGDNWEVVGRCPGNQALYSLSYIKLN